MLFEDNCPRYVQEKERVTQLFFESMLPSHKDAYLKLSSLTGYNISSPSQVLRLTNLLAIQVLFLKKVGYFESISMHDTLFCC